jgi:hypothetical protein
VGVRSADGLLDRGVRIDRLGLLGDVIGNWYVPIGRLWV